LHLPLKTPGLSGDAAEEEQEDAEDSDEEDAWALIAAALALKLQAYPTSLSADEQWYARVRAAEPVLTLSTDSPAKKRTGAGSKRKAEAAIEST
jgi:hypothetical protein